MVVFLCLFLIFTGNVLGRNYEENGGNLGGSGCIMRWINACKTEIL
jgi:hypothetical protein